MNKPNFKITYRNKLTKIKYNFKIFNYKLLNKIIKNKNVFQK